jgi:hypothetical protein
MSNEGPGAGQAPGPSSFFGQGGFAAEWRGATLPHVNTDKEHL